MTSWHCVCEDESMLFDTKRSVCLPAKHQDCEAQRLKQRIDMPGPVIMGGDTVKKPQGLPEMPGPVIMGDDTAKNLLKASCDPPACELECVAPMVKGKDENGCETCGCVEPEKGLGVTQAPSLPTCT